MADVRQNGGLGVIFSFFLGLMVTAFVGVGVYTFHPPPHELDDQIRELYRSEESIKESRPPGELKEADREQIRQIVKERDELSEAHRLARERWGRSTSIILVMLATLSMAVSLIRAEQLPVISNGLLLGGVFTMLYGVGWIVATDMAISRFIVITLALIITLGLGYIRFVRQRSRPAVVGTPATVGSEGVAGIEQRLRDLEKRMDEAARALGQSGR